MRNVFELAVRSNEFLPREKTLLGDIAMDFRDMGVPIRLQLNECSKISGMAHFLDTGIGRNVLYVTRHRDNGDGVVRYRITPLGKPGIDTINFDDVLISYRDYFAIGTTCMRRRRQFSPSQAVGTVRMIA